MITRKVIINIWRIFLDLQDNFHQHHQSQNHYILDSLNQRLHISLYSSRIRTFNRLTCDTINVSLYLNIKNSLAAKGSDIMKLITRDTDYSIRALIYIASDKDRIISITELVKELDIPRPFLRKILQVLSISEVLKSYKGKNGGFELARTPGKIRLLDLMEIFQGKFVLSECLFKKNICPNQISCKLRAQLDSLEELVENKVKEITLASLLE